MNKILFSAALLICLFMGFFFSSCGNDHLATNIPMMHAFIIAAPDKYSGNLATIPAQDIIYAEQNQSVKLYAGVIIDGEQYFGEDITPFYKRMVWDIDGETFNASNLKYTLRKTGHQKGSLTLVDYLDDTTHLNFDIYVNTPNNIDLVFPYNGYNQADPENAQTLPMMWDITGIDEWESTRCKIYLSKDPDALWDTKIADVDCFDDVAIQGALVEDLAKAKDSSYTFYWAVKAQITSIFQDTSNVSSSVFSFSTKITNPVPTLKLSYRYEDYHDPEKVYSEVQLVNAAGITISTDTLYGSYYIYSKKIDAQTGLKIFIRPYNRKEYKPESLTVDIPANTVTNLERVTLKDMTAPQVAPAIYAFKQNDGMGMRVYDDGSGVKTSSITVIRDHIDTIPYMSMAPGILINKDGNGNALCYTECLLHVYGEDYAGNSLPDVDWKLNYRNDSIFVTGPFVHEGN